MNNPIEPLFLLLRRLPFRKNAEDARRLAKLGKMQRRKPR